MKFILLSLSTFLVFLSANGQTGIAVPEMTLSDNNITNFLTTYNIPGATVAIAKDGKIVYMRAFGYSDIAKTTPTQPYNLFRIASLSKQITSVAIMKIMESGRLSMSSKVFGTGGLLQNHPVFSAANITDARIYNITVQNLLEHSAGWNRDLNCNPNPTTPYPYFLGGCDPISFPLRVTQLTGTQNPVTKEAHIKYLLEKGLDFAPGTSYNYSNIGFLVLGEVIEQITGLKYETYVKDSILAPLGIYDMHIAKNLLSQKQEREGEYVGNGYTTLSCYGDGTYVPWEYGGFSVEAMDAHGGWIASSRDMLKLLVAVDGFATKPDMLQPSSIATMTTPSVNNANYAKGWSVNSANNWWHTGALDGTASEQVRNSNGYTWIIILNKRNITSNSFWSALDNLGWSCLAATTTWPTWDLMASPTINAAGVTFTNVTSSSATVSWTNGNGDNRLLMVRSDSSINAFPLDGTDYTANPAFGSGSLLGANNYIAYNGTGNSVTVTGLTPGKTYYFRVVEYNKNGVTGNNALYLLGNNPQASQVTLSSLPVNLSYFKATKVERKAKLDWETQQEMNSDFFEIERSVDGNNFKPIGKVAAKGNVTSKTVYSFTDNTPAAGKNYYRLKQADKDAQYTYSPVALVDFGLSNLHHFTVVTNAGKDNFTIVQNGDMGFEKAVLVVRNAAGQTLIKQALTNTTTQTINGSSLVKGTYFVTIYTSKEAYTEKAVIR